MNFTGRRAPAPSRQRTIGSRITQAGNWTQVDLSASARLIDLASRCVPCVVEGGTPHGDRCKASIRADERLESINGLRGLWACSKMRAWRRNARMSKRSDNGRGWREPPHRVQATIRGSSFPSSAPHRGEGKGEGPSSTALASIFAGARQKPGPARRTRDGGSPPGSRGRSPRSRGRPRGGVSVRAG